MELTSSFCYKNSMRRFLTIFLLFSIFSLITIIVPTKSAFAYDTVSVPCEYRAYDAVGRPFLAQLDGSCINIDANYSSNVSPTRSVWFQQGFLKTLINTEYYLDFRTAPTIREGSDCCLAVGNLWKCGKANAYKSGGYLTCEITSNEKTKFPLTGDFQIKGAFFSDNTYYVCSNSYQMKVYQPMNIRGLSGNLTLEVQGGQTLSKDYSFSPQGSGLIGYIKNFDASQSEYVRGSCDDPDPFYSLTSPGSLALPDLTYNQSIINHGACSADFDKITISAQPPCSDPASSTTINISSNPATFYVKNNYQGIVPPPPELISARFCHNLNNPPTLNDPNSYNFWDLDDGSNCGSGCQECTINSRVWELFRRDIGETKDSDWEKVLSFNPGNIKSFSQWFDNPYEYQMKLTVCDTTTDPDMCTNFSRTFLVNYDCPSPDKPSIDNLQKIFCTDSDGDIIPNAQIVQSGSNMDNLAKSPNSSKLSSPISNSSSKTLIADFKVKDIFEPIVTFIKSIRLGGKNAAQEEQGQQSPTPSPSPQPSNANLNSNSQISDPVNLTFNTDPNSQGQVLGTSTYCVSPCIFGSSQCTAWYNAQDPKPTGGSCREIGTICPPDGSGNGDWAYCITETCQLPNQTDKKNMPDNSLVRLTIADMNTGIGSTSIEFKATDDGVNCYPHDLYVRIEKPVGTLFAHSSPILQNVITSPNVVGSWSKTFTQADVGDYIWTAKAINSIGEEQASDTGPRTFTIATPNPDAFNAKYICNDSHYANNTCSNTCTSSQSCVNSYNIDGYTNYYRCCRSISDCETMTPTKVSPGDGEVFYIRPNDNPINPTVTFGVSAPNDDKGCYPHQVKFKIYQSDGVTEVVDSGWLPSTFPPTGGLIEWPYTFTQSGTYKWVAITKNSFDQEQIADNNQRTVVIEAPDPTDFYNNNICSGSVCQASSCSCSAPGSCVNAYDMCGYENYESCCRPVSTSNPYTCFNYFSTYENCLQNCYRLDGQPSRCRYISYCDDDMTAEGCDIGEYSCCTGSLPQPSPPTCSSSGIPLSTVNSSFEVRISGNFNEDTSKLNCSYSKSSFLRIGTNPNDLSGTVGCPTNLTCPLSTSSISLEDGLTYYVQAVISNGNGTSYSDIYHFIYGETYDPWFQLNQGMVHANADSGVGDSITSKLPSSTDCISPSCVPYLFKTTIPNTSVITTNTGNVNLGDEDSSANLFNPAGGGIFSQAGDFSLKQQGYNYFRKKVDSYIDYTNSNDDWGTPVKQICDGDDDYCIWFTQSAKDNETEPTQVINSDLTFNDFKSHLFFHRGDLSIESNITVAENTAVLFIVSGDITIKDTSNSIQGAYIADGDIIVEDGDEQFQGEGSFIAWGNIDLQRNLENNQTTPAEVFTYRPDIFLKLKEVNEILAYKHKWRELNP